MFPPSNTSILSFQKKVSSNITLFAEPKVFQFSGAKNDLVYVKDFTSASSVQMVLYDDFYMPLRKITSNSSTVLDTTLTRDGTYYLVCSSPTNSATTFSYSFNLLPKYKIISYSTKTVGNSGKSTITFEGNGFSDRTKISFAKSGSDTIKSDTLILNRYKCSGLYNFNQKALGKWNIVVNFGDTTIIVKDGLEIEAYKAPLIDVTLLGQSSVRPNKYTYYTIYYHNTGNVNAYEIPLTIQATSSNAVDIQEGWDYNVPNLKNYKPNDNDFRNIEINPLTGKTTKTLIPTIPIIPPNGEGTLTFGVKMNKPTEIKVNAGTPMYFVDSSGKIVPNQDFFDCFSGTGALIGDQLKNLGISAISEVIPGFGCATSVGGTIINTQAMLANNRGALDKPLVGNMVHNIMATSLDCILDFVPGENVVKALWEISKVANNDDTYKTINACRKSFNQGKINSISPKIVTSIDPNDKIGYRSPSGSKYYNANISNFTYIINFENKTSATAPAQEVFVTDTLDMNLFDVSSFKAGYVKVGSKIVQAPVNVQSNSWDIDMRPAMNLITRVELTLDKTKGIAHWYFKAIDPKTNDLPDDPLIGFLPPNDSIGSGEGSVAFTINLKSGIGDDVSVNNRASIVFDTNAPIVTPTWSNKKDIVPPTSNMNQPVIVSDSIATLNWQGEDNKGGSGVYSYNLYMKKGTNDYVPLTNHSNLTSYDFKYEKGVKYSFYVTAIDSAENIETKVNVPDVSFTTPAIAVTISKKWNDVLVCDNSGKAFKTYQWYKNGTLLTGETKQYYQETGGLNGSYYVKATTTDNKTETSNVLNISNASKSIKVYPNPTINGQAYRLEIDASAQDMEDSQLRVTTISGKVVTQKSGLQHSMQLSGLSKGYYLIQVHLSNGELLNEKLIVK